MELLVLLAIVLVGLFVMIGGLILGVVGLSWWLSERRRKEEFRRRYDHVMRYGTPQEKQNVLLEAQNMHLEDLKGRVSAGFLANWWD